MQPVIRVVDPTVPIEIYDPEFLSLVIEKRPTIQSNDDTLKQLPCINDELMQLRKRLNEERETEASSRFEAVELS